MAGIVRTTGNIRCATQEHEPGATGFVAVGVVGTLIHWTIGIRTKYEQSWNN